MRAHGSGRDDFADVADLLRRSIVMSVVKAVYGAAAAAAERSRVLATARARIEALAQLGREQRLRNAALFFVTGALTELVLTGFVPRHSAAALPRSIWVVAAAVAAVPVFAPRAVLGAWDNSLIRRLRR